MRLSGVLAMLVAMTLSACATRGRVFDRVASEDFVIGRTTPAEPSAPWCAGGRPVAPGRTADHALGIPQLRGIGFYRHAVGANFGPDGKLVYLSNPKDPELVDPF